MNAATRARNVHWFLEAGRQDVAPGDAVAVPRHVVRGQRHRDALDADELLVVVGLHDDLVVVDLLALRCRDNCAS